MSSQSKRVHDYLIEEAKQVPKPEVNLDELDCISRVSVETPKTHVSRQSYAPSMMSKKSGFSAGRASSIRTTTTTKEKLAFL